MPLRHRRAYDKCWFRNFWHNWGPHIDFVGLITVITLCFTVMVQGTTFINETRAANHEVIPLKKTVFLMRIRQDRMDQNQDAMMRKMKLVPASKTSTEKMLEKASPDAVGDEGEATSDME